MRLNVRQANLDLDLRGLFEQYGEQVVAFAVAHRTARYRGASKDRQHDPKRCASGFSRLRHSRELVARNALSARMMSRSLRVVIVVAPAPPLLRRGETRRGLGSPCGGDLGR